MHLGKKLWTYEGLNERKMFFVCGDFKIDLLNPLELPAITKFINTMYYLCLYPVITRPNQCNIDQ